MDMNPTEAPRYFGSVVSSFTVPAEAVKSRP